MSEQTTPTSIITKPELSAFAGKSLFPWRKGLIAAAVVVFLIFTLIAAGLAVFTGYVLFANEQKPVAADAIVVVTGGAGRLTGRCLSGAKGWAKSY